ncbi:cell wall-binding repeat-containing protein [Desulfosporosinus meridiei]|uniref:Cell wall-binding protein n=1 Tax=Desulfosporosinus meridiei (strain ATCC BAA-275 / DSM 13257 / KCTC 12902 / NCIMB 13706 / S10) TaxID=768704 RepID=J7J3M2_DESMD|nr:cell wall-binding repeat-containing protein [Desulfosporosinus meridiei]AFQ45863.1 cell wall-binding protein [Desulfosporosinus meridiei DSM 13257]
MRLMKKFTWVGTLLTLLLIVTGCSQNQQVLFDAAMKMQNVTSLQQQTTMTFNLSGSDFDPSVQQQINTAAAFVNNAKLDVDVKTMTNEEKTVGKSQATMGLSLQGMNITVPVWIDSDLTGAQPKVLEIVKLPQMATASLPPQFAAKEYMVLNPYNMGAAQPTMNLTQLAEFTKNFQSEQVEFLTSYSKRFNPDVNVVAKGSQYVQTNDGRISAKLYEVKLNDAQLKEFIRYTVNNFTQDKEAMLFVKDFMGSVLGLSQLPEGEKTIREFNQAFEEFDANKPEFLTQFNKVMDELKKVPILGDQGIELQYAIADGYVVKKSGIIDLKVDLAGINRLMNTLSSQETSSEEVKGKLSLKMTFSTLTSGINKPVEIQIPEVNPSNSFDYMDLMTSFIPKETRLAGQDGFKTARIIAEEYNSGECSSIILVSGHNFTDALSASLLSKKFEAPILLAGSTVEDSAEAFDYINKHSNSATKILIIGGTAAIGSSIETELIKGGHGNIERLSGYDRYDTGMAVVNKANVQAGTPVVVVSGESFPDALSTASFVGANQYPALLTSYSTLSAKTKEFLAGNKPATVYIVGGVGIISPEVEAQIRELVPNAVIKRLAGNDRFDTTGVVVNEFAVNPKTVYLANGFDYVDAVAGSALAAKTGDPILLIDPKLGTLPTAAEAYLKKLSASGSHPTVRALGGAVVVPDSLIKQAERVLNGM